MFLQVQTITQPCKSVSLMSTTAKSLQEQGNSSVLPSAAPSSGSEHTTTDLSSAAKSAYAASWQANPEGVPPIPIVSSGRPSISSYTFADSASCQLLSAPADNSMINDFAVVQSGTLLMQPLPQNASLLVPGLNASAAQCMVDNDLPAHRSTWCAVPLFELLIMILVVELGLHFITWTVSSCYQKVRLLAIYACDCTKQPVWVIYVCSYLCQIFNVQSQAPWILAKHRYLTQNGIESCKQYYIHANCACVSEATNAVVMCMP